MRRKQTVNRSGENGTTTARKKEQMKEVGKKRKKLTGAKAVGDHS